MACKHSAFCITAWNKIACNYSTGIILQRPRGSGNICNEVVGRVSCNCISGERISCRYVLGRDDCSASVNRSFYAHLCRGSCDNRNGTGWSATKPVIIRYDLSGPDDMSCEYSFCAVTAGDKVSRGNTTSGVVDCPKTCSNICNKIIKRIARNSICCYRISRTDILCRYNSTASVGCCFHPNNCGWSRPYGYGI